MKTLDIQVFALLFFCIFCAQCAMCAQVERIADALEGRKNGVLIDAGAPPADAGVAR